MTEQHPITPPPELVEKLRNDAPRDIRDAGVTRERHLVIAAYRAGADQELEACIEYIAGPGRWFVAPKFRLAELRAARRPRPASLREQALAQTNAILDDPNRVLLIEVRETLELSRRALERLQELENNG